MKQTSTLPSRGEEPPDNLISPSTQSDIRWLSSIQLRRESYNHIETIKCFNFNELWKITMYWPWQATDASL